MEIHRSSSMYEDECTVVSNEDNDTNDKFSRDRCGHPVGTAIVSKQENELRRVKVHNNISINIQYRRDRYHMVRDYLEVS